MANLSNILDETIEADLADDSAVEEVDEIDHFDDTYSDMNAGSEDKSEMDNNRIRRVSSNDTTRIRLVCGRGRRRIDNCRLIVEQVRQAVKELQRLVIKARTQHDFTGAQALDAMAGELKQQQCKLDESLQEFTFLSADSEDIIEPPVIKKSASNNVTHSYININEKIARDGTKFFTADFIFQNQSIRSGGHSIGSLAIVAGAGAVLRHIRQYWPDFTALKGKSGSMQSDSPASPSPPLGDTMFSQNFNRINFRDVNQLRLLGFDPVSLKSAGFSDIDIITAGFTAEQLRYTGFGSVSSLKASGLTDAAMRVVNVSVGNREEQLIDTLLKFYTQTDGVNWKESKGWKDLKKVVNNVKNGHRNGQTSSEYFKALSSLYGTRFDSSAGEVRRINLQFNSLKGGLMESIGFLNGLTHLCLSENYLKGPIPSSIGLLIHLDTLLLDHNEFSGEVPKTLKNLTNLAVLRLENNKLTGCIPMQLCQLQFLRRLDLSNNLLTGSIPDRIGELRSLQELLLNNNKLCGNIPSSIVCLQSLTSLYLNSNCLTGSIPSQFGDLKRLTALNLQDNLGIQVNKVWFAEVFAKVSRQSLI